MVIQQLHEIQFDIEDTIITAAISKPGEIVMLMSSGIVIRFNLEQQKGQGLFSVKSDFHYADGGFDPTAKSSIYTLDEIVVVVNDYKLHGFIHYPGKYSHLHLWREDYHADITNYPIALFKNNDGIPHIIYGAAWNHVQIMNLDTRQILTAAKSLIKEDAEEQHIKTYKNYPEDNKLAWPRPYDYFYGKLHLSPDNNHFLSAGWGWGSADVYTIYNIDRFIKNNRISDIFIGAWEHQNRGVCWINNELVALVYIPYTEGDEDAVKETPGEIHFYKLQNETAGPASIIQVPGIDLETTKINFNRELNAIIAYSPETGVAAISLEGKILFQDTGIEVNNYYPYINQFISVKERTVVISQLVK